MRNQILKTVGVISVLIVLSAVSTLAQSGSSFMVDVPFDFTVSGKTLSAGQYTVAREGLSREGLTIRGNDVKDGASALTRAIGTGDIQNLTKVVFKRYRNEYFLYQVWISGRRGGRELFKSKEERAVERDLARHAAKPETIAIVGKKR